MEHQFKLNYRKLYLNPQEKLLTKNGNKKHYKLLLNSTLEGDSHGNVMSPTSTPVGRALSRITLKAHPYECRRTIPKLLSRIQKLETIVISLMSERISRRATNMDDSHLAPNEVKSDIKSFSTLIHTPPAEVEYNNSPVLSQPTVTQGSTITSKKRKGKTKNRQNLRTSLRNEEAEHVPSHRTRCLT